MWWISGQDLTFCCITLRGPRWASIVTLSSVFRSPWQSELLRRLPAWWCCFFRHLLLSSHRLYFNCQLYTSYPTCCRFYLILDFRVVLLTAPWIQPKKNCIFLPQTWTSSRILFSRSLHLWFPSLICLSQLASNPSNEVSSHSWTLLLQAPQGQCLHSGPPHRFTTYLQAFA